MYQISIKMLLNNKAKYFGLIFGVAFATVLMSQQVSIFIGVLSRMTSLINTISIADVWVMDKRVLYLDEVEPLRDIELNRIQSVPGVLWAAPLYKGLSNVRTPDGKSLVVQLIGVDGVSLVGVCPNTIMGDPKAIQHPQSAIIDQVGFSFIWPGRKLTLGDKVELNDRRLIIKAICDMTPTFFTYPIFYVSYKTAMEITGPARKKMSFILVKARPNQDLKDLIAVINKTTGLKALTKKQFSNQSIRYLLEHTGITINFSITILLGIIIGCAITAQTFYLFVVENLKQFASLKAIGVTNQQLFNMVMTQVGIVGITGYGIGIGITTLFFNITSNNPAFKGFLLHWQVALSTAVVMAFIIVFSVFFSLRRIYTVDPAIVFRA